jgi:hypothetical protein
LTSRASAATPLLGQAGRVGCSRSDGTIATASNTSFEGTRRAVTQFAVANWAPAPRAPNSIVRPLVQDLGQSQLIGKKVATVSVWPGASCVIGFGPDVNLQVECLWRLRKQGVLVLTSEDDGQLFGRQTPVDAMSELAEALVGQIVGDAQIVPGTADFVLRLGDLSFEAISNSSGFEAWQLTMAAGQMLVAQGGGNVAVWDREA